MPSIGERFKQSNHVTVGLADSIQNQQRDRLELMHSALKSLMDMEKHQSVSGNSVIFSSLVKQIVYLACTVPDAHFLSDASECTHELFADFRILLGYFEDGKTQCGKFLQHCQDVVDDCATLVNLYKSFLRDPGYSGTSFPKPDKIKAMQRMSRIMASGMKDIKPAVPSRRSSFRTPSHSTIVQMEESISTPSKSSTVQPNANSYENTSTSSSSTGHQATAAFKPPPTPQLKSQNLPSCSILDAMMDVAPGPAPPSRRYSAFEAGHQPLQAAVPSRGALRDLERRFLQTSLRPPVFVDEDGDELPHRPPPPVSPALSDTESFLSAFRQYVKKQQERVESLKKGY